MPEITMIVDSESGSVIVEDKAAFSVEARKRLTADLGAMRETACARPLEVIQPIAASVLELANETCVRVAGIYHNSLTEGPGRRSSVLFQSCPLKCQNCYVPHLHSDSGGSLVSVNRLAAELMNQDFKRDGVTILGGEPFAQIPELYALICELRRRGCPHILCYSGYTLEQLREKARQQPVINQILSEIDVLIDGAYVESLADEAGAWTGSGNQRVIEMSLTRERDEIVLYS